jgi:ribosomal-protein-alanine N-acetyltransferase
LFRVAAYVHPDNLRSAHLLGRAGFTLEGRSVRAIMFPNLADEPQDALLYGMALR